MSQYQPPHHVLQPANSPMGAGRTIEIIVWSMFLLFAALVCLVQLGTKTDNVMQQCAIAAGNAFWMIAAYGVARAISAISGR